MFAKNQKSLYDPPMLANGPPRPSERPRPAGPASADKRRNGRNSQRGSPSSRGAKRRGDPEAPDAKDRRACNRAARGNVRAESLDRRVALRAPRDDGARRGALGVASAREFSGKSLKRQKTRPGFWQGRRDGFRFAGGQASAHRVNADPARNSQQGRRHREERSDVAIQRPRTQRIAACATAPRAETSARRLWIAASPFGLLAMTAQGGPPWVLQAA